MPNMGTKHVPQKLSPTEYHLTEARKMLTEFYAHNEDRLIDKDGVQIDAKDKIESIIQKAINGYPYCPKTFLGRVKSIAKINSGGKSAKEKNNYYNVRHKKLAEIIADREKKIYPGIGMKEIRNALNEEENRYWIEREGYYRTEFDFNNSADQVLLNQVITEEIVQRRLIKQKLSMDNDGHEDVKLDRAMDKSFTRLEHALKALGITREQREKSDTESEGNIASLVPIVEAKLKKMDAIREKDSLKEELLSKHRKDDSILELLPSTLRDIVKAAKESDDY